MQLGSQLAKRGLQALANFDYGLGSGCGLVGGAVASDTRDPPFKSSHRQNFIYQL